MRCLYCGKELPLFKRLRGGEFCSDAHRLSYQEEYTQLALNRLLQANASGEPTSGKPIAGAEGSPSAKAGGKTVDTKVAEARPKETRPLGARPIESPALKRRDRLTQEAPAEALQQTALLDPEPVVTPMGAAEPAEPVEQKEEAAATPVPEEQPPAGLGGFLIEVPLPLTVEIPAIVKPEMGLSSSLVPALPRREELRTNADDTFLSTAGPVPHPRFVRAGGYAAPRERGLEEREFVRSPAPVEVRLVPAGEAKLESSAETLAVEFEPHPPEGLPALWQETAREFAVPGVILEESARLDFESTGWGDTEEEESSGGNRADAPKAGKPARPIALAPREPARPQPILSGSISPASTFNPSSLVSPSSPVSLERIRLTGVATSIDERPAGDREKQERTPPATASAPDPALIPEAVTKPLPLTLHGLAPVRGKPVQVFSSALPRPAEIQAPRQSGLPLRPVMVLGTAAQPEPEKQLRPADSPAKREPQPSLIKPRKSEVRVLRLQPKDEPKKAEAGKEEVKLEPVKPDFKLDIKRVSKQPAKVEPPNPVPVKAPVPPPVSAARKEIPVESKPVNRIEKVEGAKPKVPDAARPKDNAPAPPSREADLLGLPKLSAEAEGNFWTKLPAAARIGVAAGILAAIIIGVFLTSRGSSTPRASDVPRTQEPTVVEAGPPIGNDAGWATDWFADGPGARQPRHVDVLKGSLSLRDYRIEFEGQIDQQAIGWVFRASNKSNFYVEKVQIVSPGLEPTVALIRFAVINGKEQPREQIALPLKVHLDTMYKIRTDVVNHRFETWVQDQEVDTWTDNRIDSGGVGLYYDSGDSAKLKGTINLTPLKVR